MEWSAKCSGRIGDDGHLTAVISRIIRRADVELGQPMHADNEVAPIRTVREMILTGRRFRNCLGTDPKIVSAIQGRRAYAIFRESVVLEFAPLTSFGWLYLNCYGHGNSPVGEDVEQEVRAKVLAARGRLPPRHRASWRKFFVLHIVG